MRYVRWWEREDEATRKRSATPLRCRGRYRTRSVVVQRSVRSERRPGRRRRRYARLPDGGYISLFTTRGTLRMHRAGRRKRVRSRDRGSGKADPYLLGDTRLWLICIPGSIPVQARRSVLGIVPVRVRRTGCALIWNSNLRFGKWIHLRS